MNELIAAHQDREQAMKIEHQGAGIVRRVGHGDEQLVTAQHPVNLYRALGRHPERRAALAAPRRELRVRVLARVRVHTRKVSQPPVPDTITIGEATINFKKQLCKINSETIGLSTKECGILRLLAELQGGVVTRDEFLDRVWGYHSSPTTRTVDNFIKELRKKLGETGKNHILTVRGQGYRLKIASKPL